MMVERHKRNYNLFKYDTMDGCDMMCPHPPAVMGRGLPSGRIVNSLQLPHYFHQPLHLLSITYCPHRFTHQRIPL